MLLSHSVSWLAHCVECRAERRWFVNTMAATVSLEGHPWWLSPSGQRLG